MRASVLSGPYERNAPLATASSDVNMAGRRFWNVSSTMRFWLERANVASVTAAAVLPILTASFENAVELIRLVISTG